MGISRAGGFPLPERLISHKGVKGDGSRRHIGGFRNLLKALMCIALTLGSVPDAAGQSSGSRNEFWPELNVYVNLNDKSRLYVEYSATSREDVGSYAEGQVGIFFDFWTFPPLRSRLHRSFDASLSKLLMIRTGYEYSSPKNNSGASTVHTLREEVTPRVPLPGSFLLSDRNRVDFRWVDGGFTWRYRNRLRLERTIDIGRFAITPYVQAEAFYTVDQGRWTRTRGAVGAEFAITRRLVYELYYLRQNDRTAVPSRVNAIGMALQVYLR